MKRFFNRLVHFGMDWVTGNGLRQALQHQAPNGVLSVPEVAAAARAVAAEGIVLLQNDGETLPLRPSDTVAVFGRCAVDYFTVGYGSGGDVVSPYRINLLDGLREQGVALFAPLEEAYRQWCADHRPDEGFWGHWPTHYPEMPLPDALLVQAARESTIALVVIGRAAGEDRDSYLEPGSYYLTPQERALLRRVSDAFSRVAVILDCGNVLDLGWAVDFSGALVLAWQGGMESGRALADVLTGRVNPSGRLSDTIARDYGDYPSAASFGNRSANAYQEDIYVGYRYFETFAPEKVLFPFGFGLSYTTFSLIAAGEAAGGSVTLTVDVENQGKAAGKTVAQAYLVLPQGKLGNPRKILCAFQKSKLLAPGERQRLNLTVSLSDFAPFDDTGATGHRNCHVLEPGRYAVEVGENARDTVEVLAWEQPALEVVRRCDEICPLPKEHGFSRMVNRDGLCQWEAVPTGGGALRRKILEHLPAPLPVPEETVTFADVLAGTHTAAELVGQLSLEELDQLVRGQGKMNAPEGPSGNAGAFGGVTAALRRRGLPPAITCDGPAGIRLHSTAALLPCGTAQGSTFNPEAVEALYALVAQEMEALGVDMLLAPGMNIHRNPLCGRNFEYLSEDPLVTGVMAAAVVRGIQSRGRSACPKHFACNNQETNRNRNDSRLSQRALRELYLKGFEIVVKTAEPMSIMTSYNRVNGVYSHYHYDLAVSLLRREWGYQGLILTDWWMRHDVSPEFPALRDDAYRIRAGVDLLMPGSTIGRRRDLTLLRSLRASDGVTKAEAQQAALHVVEFLLRLKR